MSSISRLCQSCCEPDTFRCDADLHNTVIVLPRVVPQVSDLSPEAFRPYDPREWNIPLLAGLVQGFLNRTGATTLPSLQEWTTLPDKVRADALSGNVTVTVIASFGACAIFRSCTVQPGCSA